MMVFAFSKGLNQAKPPKGKPRLNPWAAPSVRKNRHKKPHARLRGRVNIRAINQNPGIFQGKSAKYYCLSERRDGKQEYL